MVLKIRSSVLGTHVHCEVFAGPEDGNLAHVGKLVFRPDEWLAFRETILIGASVVSGIAVRDDRFDVSPIEHAIFEVAS